jgi:hypothetical protein
MPIILSTQIGQNYNSQVTYHQLTIKSSSLIRLVLACTKDWDGTEYAQHKSEKVRFMFLDWRLQSNGVAFFTLNAVHQYGTLSVHKISYIQSIILFLIIFIFNYIPTAGAKINTLTVNAWCSYFWKNE